MRRAEGVAATGPDRERPIDRQLHERRSAGDHTLNVSEGRRPRRGAEFGAARADRLFEAIDFRPQRGGMTTAYLCERHTCLPPVTNADDLNRLLDEGTGVMWVSF